MGKDYANAYPRKRFFVEMFTRDVTLADCILDLIDNAIDGLVRTRRLDLGEGLLADTPVRGRTRLPTIKVDYSPTGFEIADNCGGISMADARNEAFNFGHSHSFSAGGGEARLGVYGIGLKRAVFKMGREFEVESRTTEDGFRLTLDVDKWLVRDQHPGDWRMPLETAEPARSLKTAGTRIQVRRLREDVQAVVREDPTLSPRLRDSIGKTYGLLLGKHVDIVLNGEPVAPWALELGVSEEVTPALQRFEFDGVSALVLAGLSAPDARGQWSAESAGWYVACNGRLVVVADQTALAGWATGSLSRFHMGKFRSFRGIALLWASEPLKLPWTTSKRGLNTESPVYLCLRHHMLKVTRPVLDFLNRMYPQDPAEAPHELAMARSVRPQPLTALKSGGEAPFEAGPKARRMPKTTQTVQYAAQKADLDLVRRHLREPDISNVRIGEYTFQYYLRAEGLK